MLDPAPAPDDIRGMPCCPQVTFEAYRDGSYVHASPTAEINGSLTKPTAWKIIPYAAVSSGVDLESLHAGAAI